MLIIIKLISGLVVNYIGESCFSGTLKIIQPQGGNLAAVGLYYSIVG